MEGVIDSGVAAAYWGLDPGRSCVLLDRGLVTTSRSDL